jgi:hypothetical protein
MLVAKDCWQARKTTWKYVHNRVGHWKLCLPSDQARISASVRL